MGLLNKAKLWALVDFIDKVEASKIVDLLESFARRYFGEKWKESMKAFQAKLANVVMEIQKRVK